ncbi:MAG: GNAT family N-acetyltransferase [Saprospiraceae bacterium]
MEIKIRTATLNDMEAVHQLVNELAIYEKEPDAFIAPLSAYQQDFKNGIFEVQVAETAGKFIGMVFYYMAYSTWKGRMLYLEDFVVAEEYRGKGVGQMLFDQFIQTAREKNCVMVKWQVLDWNEPAINFYEKNEATIEKGWYNVKIIF